MNNLIKRIFFGKIHVHSNNNKLKLKTLEKGYLMLLCSYFIVVLFFGFMVYGVYKPSFYTTDSEIEAKVEFINMTDSQIHQARIVLKDLKANYLRMQNEIVISNDSDFCDAETNHDCWGVNINRGESIYVEYEEDIDSFKETLCHELLHTFIYPSSNKEGDLLHAIIYDLGRMHVCFLNKDLNNSHLNTKESDG